ncbi:MAG: P1 family peptidase [Succinivibrio sp.]|nr:P1 family peptidase [Succinivibrio sp.]
MKKIMVFFLFGMIILDLSIENCDAMDYKEIKSSEFNNVLLGNAQDNWAKTGVTVAIFPQGATVGVDISGGGPASRETPVVSPLTSSTPVNAIVLAGGSAYGLAAADGVMNYLEERKIGYDTGFALVPIVVQSDLYDLSYGSAKVRPDAAMGKAACENAFSHSEFKSGLFGAGTGATIGKIRGMKNAMKSGLGVYAIELGELKIAAIVAVNALGDVYDERNGTKIGGMLNDERTSFADSCTELYKLKTKTDLFRHQNTTIGMIITNARFNKDELSKIAAMTRNAYARSIKPVGTTADGDTIYAASTGEINGDLNMVGTLAAEVMSEAIRRAVLCSKIEDSEYLSALQPAK